MKTSSFDAKSRRIASPLRAIACAASIGLCTAMQVQAAPPGPVPVTIVNTPLAVSPTAGEQPFELSYNNINTSDKFVQIASLYTVPAGKRLLIKSATFFENSSGGTSARTFTVILIRRGDTGDSYATIQTAPNTGALAGATQPMHLGARAGEHLLATVTCSGPGFAGVISLSGVLIDAP